jgi:acetyl-CoA acetyltransferase
MRDVVIIGVGQHAFGRLPHMHIKELGKVAIWNAINDAGIPAKDIETMFVATCITGLITGQEGVRGQVIERYAGFGGITLVNVENACAGGTTAVREAWKEVALGLCDVALAVGAEKMFIEGNTPKSIAAVSAASQVELSEMGYFFPSLYAMRAKRYMMKYGITREQIAKVAAKNSYNGSLNPYAQYRTVRTPEEVLNAKIVADPLTIYMCSSISDGAAAVILCSREKAMKYNLNKPLVKIRGIALKSGQYIDPLAPEEHHIAARGAKAAYEMTGVEPKDIDIAEVHDAFASAELERYEDLGFCDYGEGGRMIDEGRTNIQGDIPVNTSGGLVCCGHPVSASGVRQICEIVWQMRGEAGKRQVPKKPRLGLAQIAGGNVEGDTAAGAVAILENLG